METVSCCGIMCNECPVFIATERDDDSMRRFLALEFSDGERKFYPKDISCCSRIRFPIALQFIAETSCGEYAIILSPQVILLNKLSRDCCANFQAAQK